VEHGDEAVFQLQAIPELFTDKDQVFGFVHSKRFMGQQATVELTTQQVMMTSFIPMYYIVGAISEADLKLLQAMENVNFDTIYHLLSRSCCFLPSYVKSFQEKLKF